MPVEINRRLFTVDEYYRMGEAGVLCPDDREELIEGEVVTMSPPGSRHAACVDRATRALVTALGDLAILRVQNPVRLNRYTEPQPDLAVVRPRADFYAARHPEPADVLLVVEVALSSLDYDRDVKARLYAEAGLPEYWLVDIADESVWRHAEPRDGAYRDRQQFRRGDSITPHLLPECPIAVDVLCG